MGAPSVSEQKREVSRLRELHEAKLHEGDRWFAVSTTWWKAWLRHTENGGPDPETIDNSNIVDSSGKALKDDGVSEGSEYELRHEAVWEVLREWYGATHEISGAVHRNSKEELYVEIFPVRFYVLTVGPQSGSPSLATNKLLVVPRSVLFADLEGMVRDFLGQESRVVVPADTDTRIWICEASADAFNLVHEDVMEEELKDALIGLGRWKILFEMKSTKARHWLCGDGSEEVTEKRRYSMRKKKSSNLDSDEDEEEDDDLADASSLPRTLRGRAASFVRDEPLPGQLVDAKRRKDNRWYEAQVVDVSTAAARNGAPKRVLRVHFLTFPDEEDEDFDLNDTERLANPYTRVPDWRTQLRKDEEIEVHRDLVPQTSLTMRGTWLLGTVKQFDRTVTSPAVAENASDGSSGTDEMDMDEADATASATPDRAAKPKRKRRNLMRPFRGARLSLTRSSASPPSPPSGKAAATTSRGVVLVEVRTGSLYTQRKEVWIDLDSEYIAQKYTHTAKPKTTFGPQSVQERPEAGGIVGLRNLGNTCFMNSMLQCLSFTLPLTDYFLRGEYEADLNRKNPLGTGGKLAEAYAGLIKEIWSDRYRVVVPTEFKHELGRAFTQFQGFQQQDSHELFSLLLDGLHEDLNRVKKKPYTETVESQGRPDEVVASESWDVFKLRNESVIVDDFMGLLRSHLTCPVCENEAVKFDPYSNWSVPIPKSQTRRINIVLHSLITPTRDKPAPPPKLMRFVAEVPVNGTHADVAAWLSDRTGIAPEELLLLELYNNKKMAGSILHDPTAPPPATKAEEYRLRYHSDLKNWDDSKDLMAYEIPILRGNTLSSFSSPSTQATRTATTSAKGPREAAAAAAIARQAPKSRIVELRFMYPDSTYLCFRMSEFFLVEGRITSREMLEFIWQRCRFMFRDDAEPPAAFSAEFSPNPEDRPGLGEKADISEVPYNVYNSMVSKVVVPVTDSAWNPSDTIIVKFTRAGLDALRFPTASKRAITTRRNQSWEERNESYGLGPVELDESAENLRGHTSPKESGIDIYECFNRFREREQLGENDEWYCPKCKDFVKAYKQMDLWSTPEILVVHLKRFYYERSRYVRSWIDREKINDLVDFPMEGLDLTDFVRGYKEGDPAPIYDLYAVSNHIGGMGGGHYTAFVHQTDSGAWYNMDDSRTSVAKPEEVVSELAYVLFYKRRSG
ncbi:Ubiquitin carboxyl-terminal hydrolase, putative [Hondaea fermentalgiana]|uniref:Ubiquitin carboxyl-terminal hydrolase, putative n=1 Tax=Hondaea fermentalgiana TaxID=2315210 RepID=A0A2R5GRZ6_9STRA|nr:Ubiquitin carboxyl-terminal hydrolase, putative [Hondaea fermentalgiana]|eukprot:GBG33620.1 Ubiquitin carboxyl-terminal hydrolase, putative [Hondaea fermentalgiana]